MINRWFHERLDPVAIVGCENSTFSIELAMRQGSEHGSRHRFQNVDPRICQPRHVFKRILVGGLQYVLFFHILGI